MPSLSGCCRSGARDLPPPDVSRLCWVSRNWVPNSASRSLEWSGAGGIELHQLTGPTGRYFAERPGRPCPDRAAGAGRPGGVGAGGELVEQSAERGPGRRFNVGGSFLTGQDLSGPPDDDALGPFTLGRRAPFRVGLRPHTPPPSAVPASRGPPGAGPRAARADTVGTGHRRARAARTAASRSAPPSIEAHRQQSAPLWPRGPCIASRKEKRALPCEQFRYIVEASRQINDGME